MSIPANNDIYYFLNPKGLLSLIFFFAVTITFFFTPIFQAYIAAAAGPPQVITLQGRLTDANGDLVGGSSGTTYYFKFSLHDASSGGAKLWPPTASCTHSLTVREGVFTAHIGDTSECADVLDYDFRSSEDVYVEIEVSSDNNTFETLAPRQRVTSSAFSLLSAGVSAPTTQSTFGTTTPVGNSLVTVEATSSSAIPLSLRGAAGQVANLFSIEDSTGSSLFSVDSSGVLSLASALGELYGGTGQTTYSTGDILYADGPNSLTRLSAGSNGQVLKLSGGVPSWGTDSVGSGGSGLWATTTDSLATYPVDTTDVVLIGSNATTSTGNIFEVVGASLFDDITVGGTITIGGDSINEFAGAGLTVSGNALTLDGSLYTSDDFTSDLAATSSVDSITTLSNLSITESQISDLDHWDTTDFVSALAATSSIDSITTLNNLSITESQISDLNHTTDTNLTQEEVEDFAGGMVDSNTETLITVTYQDGDGTLDFVVDNDLSNYDNTTSGFITDYTVTENDVTAHEAALSITESQISDLDHWDTTDFVSALAATSSVDSITTLSNLSITEDQISNLDHFTGADITGSETAFDGWDKNAADDYVTADFTADLAATSSVDSITTLSNLSITESQISDLDHWDINDFVASLAATSSVDSITTLSNLSITESQISNLDHFTGADITGSETAFDGWDKNAADDYATADFVSDLAATSSVDSITTLSNLSITESQISDLDHWDINDFVASLAATSSVDSITTLNNLSITESQISDLGSYITGVAWGDITGTLSNQTDLQSALDGKISVSTTSIDSITELSNLATVGTLSSGTLSLGSLSYSGTLGDSNIADNLTISSSGSVADGALSANVSLLGNNIEDGEVDNDLTIDSSSQIVAPTFSADNASATSTFSGGLDVLAINQTGSATSTFNNGINLANGCFAVNGTCITGGGGGTWGSITGTLSDQTDLQNALDAKIAIGTTSVDSITTLSNLSITENQISDLSHYTDTDTADYINASTTIWNNTTEASLESFLTDVTNVFTNNDGALSDDDITDDFLGDLANVSTSSTQYGNFLAWDGSNWTNFSTSTQLNVALSDTTGTLGETSGGTGQTTYSTGDILYADGPNSLTVLSAGSNGQVLKLSGGVPSWGVDNTGGGGGSGLWATTTDDLAIYPNDTSDVVLIGSNATTSTGNIFEVVGASLFDGITVGGTITIGGDSINEFAGAGLTVSGNALTLDGSLTDDDLTDDTIATLSDVASLTNDTVLTREGGSVVSSTTLSAFLIDASIARDSELHNAVTLAGNNYLTLNGQEITAGDVNLSSHVTGTLDESNIDADIARDSELYTTADFTADLAATSSVDSITTLSNLSITENQISDLSHYTDTDTADYINASTTIWNNTTEASLESFLTDVTNVFTNNDGALSDDDLTDDTIATLSDVASLSDDTVLTREGGSVVSSSTISAFLIDASIARDSELYTTADFTADLAATSSVDSIVTLSNLSITESQVSDLDHFTGADITGSETAFDGWDKNAADDYVTADFTADLAATSSVDSITTLSNLSITENQISDLSHYTDTDTADYINASTTIWNNTTEASLESFLTDVTNVFTNNDGALDDDDISDDTIQTLSNVDTTGVAISDILMWDGTNWVDTSTSTFATESEVGTESAFESNFFSIFTPNDGALDDDDLTDDTISTLSDVASLTNDTVLTREGGSVVSSSTISAFLIDASIARDTELHDAVTLAGNNYLSLSGQEITAGNIDLANHVTGTLDESNIDSTIARDSELYTTADFTADLAATSSVDSIVTLSNLSITESQVSDLDHFTGADITGSETAFDGWDKNAADDYVTADFTADLAATSSVDSITTLSNLSITENQISDLSHYTDTDTADYINASTTIWNNTTEASLESFLTDVTNVFTNNDGALDDDDLTDDSIETLSDVSSITKNYGDLLGWNGSAWADFATSSLAINLSDTAGTLGETSGGTGQTTYSAGDILYADGPNSLTVLSAGSNGSVLKLSGGVPTWGTDSTGGGGGSGLWATTTDDLVVYPADTSDVVVIGSNATTSTGNIFEVVGASLFDGITADGATTLNSTLSVTGQVTLSNTTGGLLEADGSGVLTASSTVNDFFIADDLTISSSGSVADGALSSNVSLLGQDIDLASEVSGTLPIGSGGTGQTSFTNDTVLTINGSGAFTSSSTIRDFAIDDALTISSSGSVADGALSANVSLLGQNIEDGEVDDDITIDSSNQIVAPTFSADNASATSTFSGGLDVLAINQTGSATSTFNNGIDLANGCFSVNGTCISGGGSSEWTDLGGYLHPTETADGLILGDSDIINDSLLTLQATSTSADLIFASSTAGFAGDYIDLVDSAGSSVFKVNSSGNVGIGTSSPSSRLEIRPSQGTNAITAIDGWDSNDTDIDGLLPGTSVGSLIQGPSSAHITVGLRDNDSDDSFSILSGGGNFDSDSNYDTVVFYAGAGGNVGIGTASAGAVLDIQDGDPTDLRIFDSEIVGTSFESVGRLDFYPDKDDTSQFFSVLSTDRFGDSTKDFFFQVQAATGAWNIFEGAGGGSEGLVLSSDNTADDAPIVFAPERTEAVRVTSAGNLGIGTTSPTYKLSVEGSSTLGNEAIAGYFTGTTTATSTLAGGLDVLAINQTGSATSTFAGGIQLSGGCFQDASGSCVGGGSQLTEDEVEAFIFDADAETIQADWDNTANPWADNEVTDALTISGGTIDNTPIGASTASTAIFTDATTTSATTTNLAISSLTSTVLTTNADGTVVASSTLTDAYITDALTISASGSVADGALSANVSLLGQEINASELADEDFGDFTVSSGVATLDTDTVSDNEIDYTQVTLADFDIDDFTGDTIDDDDLDVAVGGTGTSSPAQFLYGPNDGTLVSTSTISQNFIDQAIARDSELHDAVTLSGSLDYLTLSGQEITRNAIDLTTDVTGTLPISSGGTGQTSFTNDTVLTIDGSGNFTSSSTIRDFAIDDAITISGSGSVTWSALTSYPSGCTNQFVTAVGDTLTCASVDLVNDVTGTLGETNGGTGQATYAAGDILYASGADTLSRLSAGTDGNILSLSSGAPAWVSTSTFFTSNDTTFAYNNAATSTIPDNTPYAWTVATSTTNEPWIRIDTDNGGQAVFGRTGGNVVIGDIGTASNLVFEESSTISGQGGNTITLGQTGDTFNAAVNFGVSSSTPWKALSVNGNVAFQGLTASTGAGSICLSTNNELVYNDGSDSCLSSLRDTKEDITELDVDGLSAIEQLRPVSFVYIKGSDRTRYGFIAEDVSEVDEHLPTYNANNELTGIDDRAVLSVTVKAVQELHINLETIASTTASTTPQSEAFAGKFFDAVLSKVQTFLADTANGVTSIVANTFQAKERICVDGECLTASDVRTLLELAEGSSSVSQTSVQDSGAEEDTEAPVITIAGNNPAEVAVGDTYNDLGATVTDNEDENLGIKASVNGEDVGDQSNISIDTSEAGTHEIEYRATDNAGNTGTATRTVIVGEESSSEDSDGQTETSTTTEEAIVEPEPDTTAPEITVLGELSVEIEVGDEYTDAGAEATDDTDGDITGEIITDNPVDPSAAGEYTVTYVVSDAAGNEASASRSVTVVEPEPVSTEESDESTTTSDESSGGSTEEEGTATSTPEE